MAKVTDEITILIVQGSDIIVIKKIECDICTKEVEHFVSTTKKVEISLNK